MIAHRVVVTLAAAAGLGVLLMVVLALPTGSRKRESVGSREPQRLIHSATGLANRPATAPGLLTAGSESAGPNGLSTAALASPEALVETMLRSGFDLLSQGPLSDLTLNSTDDTIDAAADHRALLVAAMREQQEAVLSTPPAPTPAVATAVQAVNQIHPWRRASRALDQTAAELDDAGSFEQADAIRRVAEQLRLDARATIVR